MTPSRDERRCHKRFPKSLSVTWQSEASEPKDPWQTAFLKDVSRGGLAMQCGKPVGVGDRLRLKITLDLSTPPFICIGEVIWVKRSAAGYEAGILFLRIGLRDADWIDMLAEEYERKKGKI